MTDKIRVLLVDDHELFRRGLSMVLSTEADIDVHEASNGHAAIELVRTLAPDVVLLDVLMPHESGVEVCRTLNELSPSTGIIMLTSSDDEADLFASVKNGASGYLLKDSSIDEVADAVRLVASGQSLISPAMATKLLDEFKTVVKKQPVKPAAPHPTLSTREIEVLTHVARGQTNKQIAQALFIAENTVKNHIRNILVKLQLKSRMEAAMYAVREQIVRDA